MSEEKLIQEINDIYKFLTEQEPTPDDEIDARDKLINKFKTLKSKNTNPSLDSFIGKTLQSLDDFDPLDLWFAETEIPKQIQELIELATKKDEPEPEPEPLGKKAEPTPAAAPQFDISQIVAQVSDQFKGEIGGLKDQITKLQDELKKKEEESLVAKPAEPKKEVKKVTPAKRSKLAPPIITLPKKPKGIPQLNITLQPKTPPRVAKAPELKPEPEPIKIETVKIEPVDITPIPAEKPKITPVAAEKPKITPVVAKKPIITPVSVEKPKITPVSVEKPKITPVSVEKPRIFPVSVEKPTFSPIPTEKPAITPISAEKPKFSPVVSEKPSFSPVSAEKPKIAPFTAEKPSISPVDIEEIETGAIKSSGTDLFNVFSSVGEKSAMQPIEQVDPGESKTKKKRGEKKRKRGDSPGITATQSSFAGFGGGSPEIAGASDFESASDGMPQDKDTLYQDLIALEGRRYSLEKSYKEIEKSYQKGSIDDFEYKSKGDELKYNLNEITERINNIRRIISTI